MGNDMKIKGFKLPFLYFIIVALLNIAALEGSKPSIEEEEDDYFEDEVVLEVKDPFAFFNRPMYRFNDALYSKVLRPVAVKYRENMPESFRLGVKNFFSNLGSPVRMLGNLLQGRFKQSGKELGRFAINSTIGMAGIFDAAKHRWNIEQKNEDLGQVLGKWGFGPGLYLHLPILGPTNTRDFLASTGDGILSLNNYFFPHNFEGHIGMRGLSTLNGVSYEIERLDALKKDASDPYTFSRDAYWQFREAQVQD